MGGEGRTGGSNSNPIVVPLSRNLHPKFGCNLSSAEEFGGEFRGADAGVGMMRGVDSNDRTTH